MCRSSDLYAEAQPVSKAAGHRLWHSSTAVCSYVAGCPCCRGPGTKGKAAAEAAAAQQAADADEARRRFGNAKSISSSMFNEEGGAGNNDYERTARLSKFQVRHVWLNDTKVSQEIRALKVLMSSCGSHGSMSVVHGCEAHTVETTIDSAQCAVESEVIACQRPHEDLGWWWQSCGCVGTLPSLECVSCLTCALV